MRTGPVSSVAVCDWCYREAVASSGVTKRVSINNLFEYVSLRVLDIMMRVIEYIFCKLCYICEKKSFQ